MSSLELQQDFFTRMADPIALRTIFDHLPDVFFFVKDRQHRLIAGSRNLLDRIGLKRECELVGHTDFDFFSRKIADSYRADDRIVFSTGKPLYDRPSPWLGEHGHLDWFLTTKVPLRDARGKVIGLMGTIRPDTSRAPSQPAPDIRRITAFLEKNADRTVPTAELARACGLSERSLYRRLDKALGITPYELSLRIRIQKAAEALIQSEDKVAEIAKAHGFCDQSTFTQHFRKRMGVTPKQFRVRHHG